MKFRINDVSVCSGGDHITVGIQRLPAGRVWTVHLNKREALSVEEDRESDREQAATDRIVSAIRESGLTTPFAIRTFLMNKEFEV